MRLVLALLLLSGCADALRPATGSGRATVRECDLTSVKGQWPETRRLLILNNPTDDSVVFECNQFRRIIPARMAADYLLMPKDKGCDMHNDVEYSNEDPGTIPIPDVTDFAVQLKKAPK